MSNTLQISNGDLFIRESTGSPVQISGAEKLSQDIAESLLVAFDAERNFGNTLNSSGNGLSIIGQVSKLDARERIEAAIDRLRAIQAEDDKLSEDEEISEIGDLEIEVRENGTEVRFFLEVLTKAKTNVSSSGTIPLEAVKLNHINPEGIFNLNTDSDPLSKFTNNQK